VLPPAPRSSFSRDQKGAGKEELNNGGGKEIASTKQRKGWHLAEQGRREAAPAVASTESPSLGRNVRL